LTLNFLQLRFRRWGGPPGHLERRASQAFVWAMSGVEPSERVGAMGKSHLAVVGRPAAAESAIQMGQGGAGEV